MRFLGDWGGYSPSPRVSLNASASLRLLFLLTLAATASARADEAFRIYDARGVRAIFDITNSGVGLAVQGLPKARDRIVIFDSASSYDLTGKACSSNGVQWNADNW